MSYLPDHIPAIVVNAVMDLLFPLLMTAARGNAADARQAALEMVAEHRPATREEYRLAGEIIAFSFQALYALRAASMPGIPNGAHLKLLNTANGLRRTEAAAQRKLDALQRARLAPPKKASKTTEKRPADPPAAAQAAPQHAP